MAEIDKSNAQESVHTSFWSCPFGNCNLFAHFLSHFQVPGGRAKKKRLDEEPVNDNGDLLNIEWDEPGKKPKLVRKCDLCGRC